MLSMTGAKLLMCSLPVSSSDSGPQSISRGVSPQKRSPQQAEWSLGWVHCEWSVRNTHEDWIGFPEETPLSTGTDRQFWNGFYEVFLCLIFNLNKDFWRHDYRLPFWLYFAWTSRKMKPTPWAHTNRMANGGGRNVGLRFTIHYEDRSDICPRVW